MFSNHLFYQVEHDFDLVLVADRLERLLNHPAAIHLQCQCEHVAAQSLRKRDLMLRGAEFKKFLKLFNFSSCIYIRTNLNLGRNYLNHIVAKHVGHQRV